MIVLIWICGAAYNSRTQQNETKNSVYTQIMDANYHFNCE